MTDPLYLWLEPGRPDLDEGLRARVADPLWFLARQWQLGELAGEDASSPVAVDVTVSHQPLTLDDPSAHGDPDPDHDPTRVPAETLVETGPGDWWTIGRRIRLGRAAAGKLDPADADAHRFGTLPSPYDRLAGQVDGRAVFDAGLLAGDPVFAEVPAPTVDRWQSDRLVHTAGFDAGGTGLVVPGHDGGDLDWFSADAGTPPAQPAGQVVNQVAPQRRLVVPTRLDYPGAPNPRWWQLEDRAVDLGGFAPDRSHLATMLLADLTGSHADDWFAFHVPPPSDPGAASSGVLVSLPVVTVRDGFGQVWPIAPPAVDGPDGWSLFHTTGLDPAQLLIWPVAVAPATGPLLDDVLIGVDEDANLAWAVESRADGLDLLAEAGTATTPPAGGAGRDPVYLPSTTIPAHWLPYQRVRVGDPGVDADRLAGAGDGRSGWWRQAVLADLTGAAPEPRPGPVSTLIGGPSGAGLGAGHELAPTAIPSQGVRLQRRTVLARDTDGRPVLWVERSSRPVAGPPTSHLRFDVFAPGPDLP